MDLFQLREQFSENGILMCFNGPFSHSLIEEIGIAIRNHLADENIAPMAVMDVFSVYIEMTQNARNYLLLKNIAVMDAGSATIIIAKRGETYIISSGNVILKNDMKALQDRIDHINTLAPDELKKMIRQQLRRETPTGAVGAGIGLMEMAKRSSGRLEYRMRDIGEPYAFFTLTVQI